MDRRSWLWRRKSSENTPGDSESSGSMSSPSDRFSDEQISSGLSKQSPDINSKVTPSDEPTEKASIITARLSAALSSINAKEELVKQHARVADEAVTGWEKAEREVSSLQLQLDVEMKKNSAHEDRIGHLDGALKECVRQLRHTREEQERKLEEVIAKRAHEWELKNSVLETQLAELSSQLEAAASTDGLRPMLEAAEKENKYMRIQLDALSQTLHVRTLERDYCTKTAESASKKHLEGIKNVAKLEAECRRLKAVFRKSSADVDSISDCRSESSSYTVWSRAVESQATRPSLQTSSSENILMDDFLEIERLSAFSKNGIRTLSPEARASHRTDDRGESVPKSEFEAMSNQTAVMEDKIKKSEAEKEGLEMAIRESQAQTEATRRHLSDCQAQLRASEGRLEGAKSNLRRVQSQVIEGQGQLRMLQAKSNAAENELIERDTKLIECEDQLSTSEGHLRDALAKSKELHDHLIVCEDELRLSQEKVKDAEARLIKTHIKLSESEGKLTASEEQIRDVTNMLADLQAHPALACILKTDVVGEFEASNAIREGAELRAKSLDTETRSLLAKFNLLVEVGAKDRALAAEAMDKCVRLEYELSKRDIKPLFKHSASFKDVKRAAKSKELAMASGKLADCQKTIASLGRQLKSLATLDSFSDDPSEFEKSELEKGPCIDCQ